MQIAKHTTETQDPTSKQKSLAITQIKLLSVHLGQVDLVQLQVQWLYMLRHILDQAHSTDFQGQALRIKWWLWCRLLLGKSQFLPDFPEPPALLLLSSHPASCKQTSNISLCVGFFAYLTQDIQSVLLDMKYK